MHLHFASTPSRSNAAIESLVSVFDQTDPGFVLSATGFHSTAHLLAMHRLGRRYIASFFGDNYPGPRPNPLYSGLHRDGVPLEVWSLGSLVSAFRAGATGTAGVVSRSLAGSDLGADLERAGRILPLPGTPDQVLVRPLRPDITFVHGLVADERGRVLFPAPWCEGAWSALAAKRGVIATVEAIVPASTVDAHPELMLVPPHRLLGVFAVPGGALPQPQPGLPGVHPGYADAFEDYRAWRTASLHHLGIVGRGRRPPSADDPDADARRILLAARWIARRVRDGGHRAILAGIGQSFVASRVAHALLAEAGHQVPVMVETGLYDLPAIGDGHAFLLAHRNMVGAGRLSDVEDILTTLTCGAEAACLGVVGAGQIDPHGDVNSTWTEGGQLLVGSGGANDIASGAAEVVVVAPLSARRLVPRVHHVTSPGRAVRSVVTAHGVLHRADPSRPQWDFVQRLGELAEDAIRSACPWEGLQVSADRSEPISSRERQLLEQADPDGIYWRRSPACRRRESRARGAISRAG